jgi:hypothetical protein
MGTKTLADVLERMVAITESMMDSGAPSDQETECPMCVLKAARDHEHDPDCAYRIARTQISPADVAEVRRLARVLRYDGDGHRG